METDMQQGSPEWFAARAGKATASRIADIMAKTKSGPSASRANYCAQLVAERLTGMVEEGYTNAAMQWGTEKEPFARAAYEFEQECDVIQVGFIDHPKIAMSGASPDGLVGDVGLLEIKCPNTATHIETLLSETVPQKYIVQMQWQMACTGREWCDFVSYDPRLPDSLSLFYKRVPRDGVLIVQMEREVREFLEEVDALVAELTAKMGKAA